MNKENEEKSNLRAQIIAWEPEAEEVFDAADDGDPWAISEQDKLIRRYQQACVEMAARVKKHFPSSFSKTPPFSPKWLTSTSELRAAVESKRGKRLFALLNILWDMRMPRHESLAIIKHIKRSPGGLGREMKKRIEKTCQRPGVRIGLIENRLAQWEEEHKFWVLVQPHTAGLAKRLGVTVVTISSDLITAVRAGLLIDLGKNGPNKHSVYVIGKRSPGYDKNGEKQPGATRPLLKEEGKRKLVGALAR